MAEEACCTCATLLRNISPQYDEKTEKPHSQHRRLECCNRVICGPCIQKNNRFATYCPFCQISTTPSPLPQGLRDPPPYSIASDAIPSSIADDSLLPAYSTLPTHRSPPNEKSLAPPEDILHFLDHNVDTVTSLAFRYSVPIDALRRKNNLTSDALIYGRRTVTIPGECLGRNGGGVKESLSPAPVEGEEEERRKVRIRKFMVACKVSEYDVAVLYLKQAEYDLELAIGVYQDDEKWEREHPVHAAAKGKSKESTSSLLKRRFMGQRS